MFELYDPIERMVRAVNQTADAALEGALAQFLDLAAFMKHVAVETFVAENDGLLGYAGMNNFYIYQFKDRPQFQVITWDKDNTFVQPDLPIFLRADRNVLMRRALTIPAARQAYLDGVIAAADSAAEGQAGADRQHRLAGAGSRTAVCAHPRRCAGGREQAVRQCRLRGRCRGAAGVRACSRRVRALRGGQPVARAPGVFRGRDSTASAAPRALRNRTDLRRWFPFSLEPGAWSR